VGSLACSALRGFFAGGVSPPPPTERFAASFTGGCRVHAVGRRLQLHRLVPLDGQDFCKDVVVGPLEVQQLCAVFPIVVLDERVATLEALKGVGRRPLNRKMVVQAAFCNAQLVERHVATFLAELFLELLGFAFFHLDLVFQFQHRPLQLEFPISAV